ncbi:class I SAM-dependent methyltransferase [Streptomyces albireticuli]|uniref:SAM-dependent methyltransferase n=1 Tax=Streptomyces albireticuli TaxID=1940 RepID=A0A2A2D1M2_9ACTN|nr:class I SAM-dependent methyltransferase [Streptomyces albireticuli]MCD9146071.1 methyltransferase domain-containing protein [Streptomyces albireticuli]MCD9166273.1 methyltransferase domain-containing protein [Streptomyces albireticuli]MCD9196593.1 methyltransferase domain-containing protein [Streptomyces albireticuli]PAU45240.1 SAM-dependent methyltransferase [Streptomyces albireticuli]
MKTQSLWQQTLTFFPQFIAALNEHEPGSPVAVVGASDGKFVLPLAEAGYQVTAIERDPVALYGGEVRLPGDQVEQAAGLSARLKAEGLGDRVQIVEGDFLDTDLPASSYAAVWTSCSWHYSANHHRPLSEFVTRMQDLIRPGGLFGAEFMMAIEPRHRMTEHYTSPDLLLRMFPLGWDILLTLRTGTFLERAHVGQPYDHHHRMGMLLAARDSAPEKSVRRL